MPTLDATTLGLDDLPDDLAREILAHAVGMLEARVGTRLAEGLSDQQLQEFEALMASGDEDAAQAWLAEVVPQYPAVVRAELERLVTQFEEERPRLVAHFTAARQSRTAALTGALVEALQSLGHNCEVDQDLVQFEASGMDFSVRIFQQTPGYLRIVARIPERGVDELTTLRAANEVSREIRVAKVTADGDGNLQVTGETHVGDPVATPAADQLASSLPTLISLMRVAAEHVRDLLVQDETAAA